MLRMGPVWLAALALAAPAGRAAAQRAAKQPIARVESRAFRSHNLALQVPQALDRIDTRPGPRGPTGFGAAGTVQVRLSWKAPDLVLAGAFTAALLIDAGQTRGLARGGWQGWRETNPILGPRPTEGQINTYTALAGLTVLGAAAAVPERLRPWVLGAGLAVQMFTVVGTVQRGVAIRIP